MGAWRCGGEVTQESAKLCTPVQFRAAPPIYLHSIFHKIRSQGLVFWFLPLLKSNYFTVDKTATAYYNSAINNFNKKRNVRMCLMRKKRKRVDVIDAWHQLEELDDESRQETVIKYLRSLDNKSLKRLYEAVELYRQGDDKLQKVVEPEPEPEESEDSSSGNE